MTSDTVTHPGPESRRRQRNGVSAAAPAPRVSNDARRSGRSFTVVSWIILVVFAVLWLIPSLWAIKTSLTPNATTALGTGPILKDWHLTLSSYATLLTGGDLWNWYLASAITSVVTVALAVGLGSMAAYALSRLRFRGRNLVFALMLLGIMIPPQVLIVPVFLELNAVGLLNTYWAVILPQVPSVLVVFVLKQFFDGLPRDFEEAARIDGASFWTIYRSVVLPLSGPVLSAMAIVTFVAVWNNLILPLFVLSNPKLMTIPVGLATVQGSYGQRLSDIQASSILGALPLVILFLIFQRRIVDGVGGSGLKGWLALVASSQPPGPGGRRDHTVTHPAAARTGMALAALLAGRASGRGNCRRSASPTPTAPVASSEARAGLRPVEAAPGHDIRNLTSATPALERTTC